MQLLIKACLLVGCLNFATAKTVEWMEILSSRMIAADAADTVTTDVTIPELASQLGLNDLVKYVKKADLVGALSGAGPFTVFGPTDDAFAGLPAGFAPVLEKNKTLLTDVLKYHVINGAIKYDDLKNEMMIPTLQGSDIRINIYNEKIVTASCRPIILKDQNAKNGVIHEVSSVLFPPPGTIMDVLNKCPVFTKLLELVKMAGLEKTLSGPGPFTMFAPSDRVLATIPEKCLTQLKRNVPALKKILEYHLVPSTQCSAGIGCGKLDTVEGLSLYTTKIWDLFYVNYAKVTLADATVSNGVMHVIDHILMPYKGTDGVCDESATVATGSTEAEQHVHSDLAKTWFH